MREIKQGKVFMTSFTKFDSDFLSYSKSDLGALGKNRGGNLQRSEGRHSAKVFEYVHADTQSCF